MENNSQQNEGSIDLNLNQAPTINMVQEALIKLEQEVGKTIVGQKENLELCFSALLVGGHVLLEGVPGVAKTLLAKSIAAALNLDFARVQFTPDLMPSDVTGTAIFNVKTAQFEFKKGPVFTQILLIDEINRAPAKTQAALFEVMQEKQITNNNDTYIMELPFFVVATQNPVEQEGTYPLPEAQLDRFIYKIIVGLPNVSEEFDILNKYKNNFKENQTAVILPVLSKETIAACASFIEQVTVSEQIMQYISTLVVATRNHPDIYLGGSPRASLNLLKGAKAFAAIKGRDFVIPDDVKYLSRHVLSHRLILQPEREMEGVKTEEVLQEIFNSIEIPR